MFIVPATIQLATAEIELVSAMARESILKDAISAIRDEFDYVFIDCPPSLGLLTINALVAADALIIPIQCEYYALEGVAKLLESMQMVKRRMNPNLEIFGVVMTMFDSRTTLSKQVVDEVQAYFGKKVFKTVIPRNVKLSEAPSHGLPVSLYARVSKGALAYSKLAREVVSEEDWDCSSARLMQRQQECVQTQLSRLVRSSRIRVSREKRFVPRSLRNLLTQ